jgi:integrase
MLKVVSRKGRKTLWLSGTVAGVRIRESTGTDQRRVAEEVRAKREAELIREHHFGAGQKITIGQAVHVYLDAGHSGRFLTPIIEAIGERRIADLTPGEIRDLAVRLYPEAKASTRNRQVIAPVVAVVNCAADRGLCQPLRVKRFKEAKVQTTSVDRDWIDTFRAAASNDWIRALALFMFTSGARLGEALSLTPSDVDLRGRAARVRRTKNGDPHDYLLTPEMAEELAGLEPRYGRVFGYTQRRHLYAAWRESCAKSGLPYVPPHQAGRHSFATEMIVRAKQDVATTAALGNWKSTRMLLENYAHAERLRETSDRVFGSAHSGTKLTPVKRRS